MCVCSLCSECLCVSMCVPWDQLHYCNNSCVHFPVILFCVTVFFFCSALSFSHDRVCDFLQHSFLRYFLYLSLFGDTFYSVVFWYFVILFDFFFQDLSFPLYCQWCEVVWTLAPPGGEWTESEQQLRLTTQPRNLEGITSVQMKTMGFFPIFYCEKSLGCSSRAVFTPSQFTAYKFTI